MPLKLLMADIIQIYDFLQYTQTIMNYYFTFLFEQYLNTMVNAFDGRFLIWASKCIWD